MTIETNLCSECQSEYFSKASQMMDLCPNCAHHLYGYENCLHQMENGRCLYCFWDGSNSAYIQNKINN